MVGLSDIPIVGKAVDMISEATVKAAYRGFRYMFCCKDLVNVLNSKIEKINIQENVVSKKVVEENESGKIVEDHVYKWQKEVKEIQEDSKKISEKYKNRRPITNPLSRFRLGREAVQKANKVAALMESGKEFVTNPIARLPPVENLPKTDSVFQDFPSRKVAYDKIWQSLITEDSPRILGIYGLPGVGKTRIAEQIWKEAKEKGIFNKVTKAVVSGEKDLDVKRLQNEVARDLNCHFESQDDIKHRASQLKRSIMYGDKVLVILDDVWREIPLHDIGIPIGDDTSSKGGCKILFTSREKKVCLNNNCIDPVEITALTVVEAWDMFKDSVGTAKIEYLPDESLAKQVCNKCGGLPLLIRTVGKALRNMSGNVWKDALDQLQEYKIECIPGIDPEVYACLKLSFDKLVKDAKACLLLSSLYPEDAYISTSMLIELGIGSKLLPGGRSRVLSMVDTLESSSLIIGNEVSTVFKLHDIIRDVARSIAVKDYAFLFAGSDLSLPHINGSPNLLCLDVKNNNNFYFPPDMIYHGLYTLWIESTSIGIHIFKELIRLISLRGNQVEAAAFVGLIERAESVGLYNTDVDVSSIFNSNREAFSDLKFLQVRGSDTMEHLARIQPHHHQIQPPTSFSQLTKLEIENCSKMKYLFCNSVAKCLVQLQYLFVYNCTVMEAIIVNEGSRTDGQEEDIIVNFSRLKTLRLYNMPKLKGFNIDKKDMQLSTSTVAVAVVSLKDNSAAIIPTLSLFSRQVAFPALEALDIHELTVSDIWGKHYYNDNASSFCKLKSLEVWSCTKLETVIPLDMLHKLGNLEYLSINNCSSVVSEIGTYGNTTAVHPLVALTDMRLQKLPSVINTWLNSIPDHSQAITVYPNLKKLHIKECNSLSNVFLPSIAGDLMHLEELHLDSCKMMTKIIGATAGDNINKDVFPNLMTCEIMYCDKIKLEDIEFWRGDFVCQLKSLDLICAKEIQLPSTWQLQIYNQLEKLTLCNCWWHEQQVSPCFSRLRQLKVTKSGRSTLFPFSVIRSLQQLEEIKISDCAFLKDIVEEDVRGNGASSTDKKIIEFIQLRSVVLKNLPNLGSFMSGGDYECHMPALSRVKIDSCVFTTLFPLSVISSLQQLEEIKISDCAFLKDIVEEDVRGNGASSTDKKIFEFIQLERVVLKDLPNLGSFMSGADYECHMPALSEVKIDNCVFTALFTCCRDLQQLDYLDVRNCGLLEYVVKDTKNDEITEANDKITTLSQLWLIELENLPNLKSFGRTSSYAFDMPRLGHFEMLRCPQVENFSYPKTTTGGSVRVRSDWCREGEYVQDLNDYIKQNCKRGSNIISDSAGE